MGLFSGPRPRNLGVRGGRLAPCPGTPNCVSSQAERAWQKVAPIPFGDPVEAARERLLAVLGHLRGTKIITAGSTYLHAEASSEVFGFVDDLECFLDATAGLIHLRSASRLGISDRGVNRKRVEEIRRLFLAARP